MTFQDQEELKIKKELVFTAQSIIEETTHLIEGCRKICELKDLLSDSNDDLFLIFVGVESETDDYPIGEIRENYEESYLKKMDQEINNYLREMRPVVLEACQRIIEIYS